MRFTVRHVVLAGATSSAVACAAILGIEDRLPLEGDGGKESGSTEAGADGTADGSTVDAEAGGDALVDAGAYRCPNGTPVHACGACGGELVACPTTGRCVNECRDQCDAGPIACVTCDGDGGYTATCSLDLTPDASCAPTSCSCSGNASECPLENMVCIDLACVTCGDVDTHDEICRDGGGGKKCKLGDDGTAAKRYRCQ